MSPSLADDATLQAQIDTCTVCESVYPNPGELVFETETQLILESWKNQLDLVSDAPTLNDDFVRRLHKVKTLKLSIQLSVVARPDSPLRISVQLPLLVGDSTNGLAKIAVQRPEYLSRADGERLGQEVEEAAVQALADGLAAVDNAGYIMDIADRLTALASALWQAAEDVRLSHSINKEVDTDDGELQRVWFWFPSLSTREKRKDLVNYASRWGLTGFVLAGKPGLLCLEGTSRQAEEYMSAIKSESWGDIPSYQKKVTERFRQPINSRAFTDMQEITHLIDQHGQRNNRGDMSQVRSWMEKHGVGDAWGSVVISTGVGGGDGF